jgi:antitoxin component of MazEF toxin-antitoxin module
MRKYKKIFIRKVGNSYGVILPKKLLDDKGLKLGDCVIVDVNKDSIY